MEEVQSWWEVPAVAHFCYVFRTAFDLFFFEIAELESALLDIQDPDMSISLDQLIIRLLQGCYDNESVTAENWEEKLHDLFHENCADEENPFNDSVRFLQLTPRSKIEVLLRLCELRLDVEGALEAIKDIPSEDMQAKCMGKDNNNNTYWYFYDERLYKENTSNGKKGKLMTVKQIPKNKEVKNTSIKNSRQVSTREKRTKATPDLDKSWTVACFNVSEWEKLMKTFTKSRNSHEKGLVVSIEKHLPLLQERVSEKNRLLRKRFVELAPKRTSSRLSKVQEKKKMEELEAQEAARRSMIEAVKQQAEIEALKMQQEKENRQKRAEQRHKRVEERAKRAELRERVHDVDSESSEDSDDDSGANRKIQKEKRMNSRVQRSQKSAKKQSEESEDSDSYESDSNNEMSSVSQQRTNKRRGIQQYNNTTAQSAQPDGKCYGHTYSNYKGQSRNDQLRVSSRLQNNPKTVKYRFDTDESEQDSDEVPSTNSRSETNTRLQQNRQDTKDHSNTDESDDESASDDSNAPNDEDVESDENHSSAIDDDSLSVQNSVASSNNYSSRSQDNSINLPRVAMYKTTLLQNSSDASKWNGALDCKGQKLHILHDTYDNLSPKKLKLEQMKNFRTASPNMKSSLSKENHLYQPVQASFITYGKIIPSSPAIVRLDFRKPPNHQVSS